MGKQGHLTVTSLLWASRPCARWVLALNLVLGAATSDASAVPAPAATAATAAAPSDHPLLTRMPGYVIEDKKEEAFGARRFGGEGQVLPGTVRLPGGQIQVEGRVTEIAYIDEQERGSVLAIYRNHLHALASLGAQALNTGLSNAQIAQGGRFLFQLGQGPASRWVALDLGSDTYRYVLTIVEPAALVQAVTAGQLAAEIQSRGLATLHLQFDTGRADLKADGLAAVQALAQLMRAEPALKLSIEGHTDHIGAAADNRKLSLQRAEAVLRAVCAQGIAPARLSALGHGADLPVADRRSEEGRARNRRVELIKRL